MARVALAFPGQGVAPDEVAAALDELAHAEAILALRSLLGRRGGEHLDVADPCVLQPALVATSIALGQRQARCTPPSFVVGHSLGEIAAAAVAGAIEVGAAVHLAVERARACAEATAARPGRMLAVTKLDLAELEWVRRRVLASGAGVLEIAACNGPRAWVLSGDAPLVRALGPEVRAAGGACHPLPISGAFHSPLMGAAVPAWAAALATVPFEAPDVPIVSSIDAAVHHDGADLRSLWERSLLVPVAWCAAQETLARHGVTDVVEPGPGDVLTRLAQRWSAVPFSKGPMPSAPSTMRASPVLRADRPFGVGR